MVVGASQSFHFLRQNKSLLGNNRAFSKFSFWILYRLNKIIKL